MSLPLNLLQGLPPRPHPHNRASPRIYSKHVTSPFFVRLELIRICHNSSPSSNKLNKVARRRALLGAVHRVQGD